MVNKLLEIDLPIELWEKIDKEFKINGETDSEILCNIIKLHLASNGYYSEDINSIVNSLNHGHGIKDY